MNLLKVSIIEETGGYFFVLGGIKIKAPENRADGIKKLKVKGLVLGIRPEHVCPSREGPFKAVISSIELIGRELLVHVLFGNTGLSFITTSREFKAGNEVTLAFDLNKLNFFKID
ncbi:MAG: hypothetical protein A2297_03890 [Elusimicrobia bacterium RIFOXYB2_FULL_48_7]|nr:MAG: hypothetical protein A2297_03890 [Elusimicrobia bacterium RIFOXYB2_FULL_48_7]